MRKQRLVLKSLFVISVCLFSITITTRAESLEIINKTSEMLESDTEEISIDLEENEFETIEVKESIVVTEQTEVYTHKEEQHIDDQPINEPFTDEYIFEDQIELLQNGDMASQYFDSNQHSPVSFSIDEENWADTLRNRVSEVMANADDFVYISDLNLNRFDDIDTVRLVYRSCIRGDRFYVSGSFSYYCDADGNITKIKIGYYSAFCDGEGVPDKTKIGTYVENFYQHASTAIEYAGKGRNKLEQSLLAHDWIVRECQYDYEHYVAGSIPAESYNAYGCLVKGVAVCNGYALAYSYIMEELGYDSYIIASDAMNHAWNMIEINSQWLHVDATWDDPVIRNGLTFYGNPNNDVHDEGLVLHRNFLKTDAEFEELGHYRWKLQNSELELPESQGRDYFTEYIFDNDASGTEYVLLNGKWYFEKDSHLYNSKDLITDHAKTIEKVNVNICYMHALEDQIYFTDFSNIYCWTPGTGQMSVVMIGTNLISELTIKNGEIVYVLYDGTTFSRNTLSEINTVPTIQSVKMTSYEKLLIQWSQVAGCEGYVLYRASSLNGTYSVIKTIKQDDLTGYTNIVSATDDYYYKVRAYVTVDGNKIYGDYSDVMKGNVISGPPANFTVKPVNETKVKFTWDKVEDADGYVICMSTEKDGTYKVTKNITDINTLTYSKYLPVGETYYFYMKSYRINGDKKIYSRPSEIFSNK